MAQVRRRSSSSASSESSKSSKSSKSSSGAARRMLKSLITLDSYEQDVNDNVQNEGMWDEENASKSQSEPQSQPSEKSEPNQATKEDEEFLREEAERDAELPEEYRKFRPRGYKFKIPPTDRLIRVYADGVFDLFHMGHMKQLEQAKKSLPNVFMVVGVPNDQLTHKYKGLTVLDENQRYESLRHCRWVDEVIPNAPWEVNEEFLDEHNIDYVAHDDAPYAGPDGQDDVYKFVKERGQFMTTQRTDGISTSDIITRIVKDYDLYLMRNFKRGVSRKELNVSWIKKNELDIKRHVNAFRESWRSNVETTTRDIYADLLSYALNASSNSVLGRARNWVSRHIESRGGSPHASDGESDSPSTPTKEDISSSEREDAEEEEERDQEPRSPKRRRLSSK